MLVKMRFEEKKLESKEYDDYKPTKLMTWNVHALKSKATFGYHKELSYAAIDQEDINQSPVMSRFEPKFDESNDKSQAISDSVSGKS